VSSSDEGILCKKTPASSFATIAFFWGLMLYKAVLG